MSSGVLLIGAGQTIVWAGLFYVFPAMLLQWEQTLGWSKVQLTAAFSVAILASAMFAPAAGRLIDLGFGRLLMAGSTLLGSLVLLALSGIDKLWQFYICWILLGCACAGCLYESCFAIVTRALGDRAKRAIVRITLMAGFAGSLSFPAVHFICAGWDWRVALQVFSVVVCFIGTPLMWFGAGLIEASGEPQVASKSGRRRLDSASFRSPIFLWLAVGFALLAVVHGATLNHLLPLLDERGVAREMAVLCASLIGPMQVLGRVLMMALEKRLSNRFVVGACFFSMGGSVLLLMFAGDFPPMIFAFVMLFGAGYGIVSIVRPVITRDILGQEGFGEKSGGMALFYLTGAALAPWFGSLLWDFVGYTVLLLVLSVMSLCGFGMYRLADRQSRLPDQAPDS